MELKEIALLLSVLRLRTHPSHSGGVLGISGGVAPVVVIRGIGVWVLWVTGHGFLPWIRN